MAARAEKESGHQVPNTSVVSEDAIDPEIKAFQEHQRTAARLPLADEVRTLVSLGRYVWLVSTMIISYASHIIILLHHPTSSSSTRWGVLCTQGRQQLDGFPCGSVVEYALTESGQPVFAFSTLSPHTGDLQTNPKASLVVTAPEFKGLADARVCLTGEITPIAQEALSPLKELYKARHPGSFWVDFGDFKWFQMENVVAARVIGGFARAGSVCCAWLLCVYDYTLRDECKYVWRDTVCCTICHIMYIHLLHNAPHHNHNNSHTTR